MPSRSRRERLQKRSKRKRKGLQEGKEKITSSRGRDNSRNHFWPEDNVKAG